MSTANNPNEDVHKLWCELYSVGQVVSVVDDDGKRKLALVMSVKKESTGSLGWFVHVHVTGHKRGRLDALRPWCISRDVEHLLGDGLPEDLAVIKAGLEVVEGV